MSRSGLLQSPIIAPLLLRDQIDSEGFIELKTDERNARIFFTLDGTNPNPFQIGNKSTFLYRGRFQLNPGKCVLKAITVTNDGLRESNIATKHIDTYSENCPPMSEKFRGEEDDYWSQKLKPLSSGNGNWKKTLEHLFLNIYNFVKDEYELRDIFGWKQFGRIESAQLIDKGRSYQIVTTFKKPFYEQTPYEEPPLCVRKPKRSQKKRTRTSFGSDEDKSARRSRQEKSKNEEEKRAPKIYTYETEQQGTLVPFPNFDADQDCNSLRKAMKGSGTDETVLIDILGNRTTTQRVEIRDAYNRNYKREIDADLKYNTSKNFRHIITNLFYSRVEYDCYELHRAIKGLGADEEILVEILASRSNKRLQKINELYPKLFRRTLEEDIRSNINGHLKKILLALLQGDRPESNRIDEEQIDKDAKKLYEARDNKWGTDQSEFIRLLCHRSDAQLKAIFEAYRKFSKEDIGADIKSETNGNLCKGLLTIVRIMRDRPTFFAYQLKKVLEKVNIDEDELNRLIISRCEIDMIQIKQQYRKIMNRSLEDHIFNNTDGDYREILLELIKDPNQRRQKPRKESPRDSPRRSPKPDKNKRDEYETPEIYKEEIIQQGTIIAAPNFDANRDADALRKAMKGAGTDEDTLIKILGNRNTTQRLEIKSAFKSRHNRDLTKDLKSETSGNFAKLLERLTMDPVELDCFELNQAVKGLGTDEEGLIEILASRSNQRIRAINETYKKMYKNTVENDVKSDTSGDFRHLLASLLTGQRPETNKVNVDQAKNDAKSLIDADKTKFTTDKARFSALYCERSDSQLKAIFKEFEKLNGKSLEEVAKKEISGDLGDGILAIIRCIKSRPHFFAERLQKAVKGLGTKESVLNRIIITRSEIDLIQIKEAYKNSFSRELERDISGDTSGDYEKLLLEILKDPSQRKFN